MAKLLLIVFAAVAVLYCARAQTTEHNHRSINITFDCSPELTQLVNESLKECHDMNPRPTRGEFFTTESTVDEEATEKGEDENGEDEEDAFTTETSSRTFGDRFLRRRQWRTAKRQYKMQIKNCVYDKIKGNSDVEKVQSQCNDQLMNVGRPESLEARVRFCVTKTVFKNCLPHDRKHKKEFGRRPGGRPGLRRQVFNRQ